LAADFLGAAFLAADFDAERARLLPASERGLRATDFDADFLAGIVELNLAKENVYEKKCVFS
jgi:hypothetical protein